MTKKPAKGLAGLAQVASEVVEAVVEQETRAINVLKAELEGLAKGAVVPSTPEEAKAQDAETEAGFDNMPV